MHHGQNRGEAKKLKLSKTCKLNENRGKFRNFDEIREYAICIIDLKAMDTPVKTSF